MDFPNLHYVNASYDCTGPNFLRGRIEMELSLEGAKLCVKTVTYDPDYVWMH